MVEMTYSSLLNMHRTICVNTIIHTTTKHPVSTHPKICRPELPNAAPSPSVAVT